jgi:hypothetical protein
VGSIKRSLTHAAGQIASNVPKAEQPAVVARVVESSKGKMRQTPARVIAGVDVRTHRAQPKRPSEQFTRALTMADEASRVLLTNAPHVAGCEEVADWLSTLTEARGRLSRALKLLEGTQ